MRWFSHCWCYCAVSSSCRALHMTFIFLSRVRQQRDQKVNICCWWRHASAIDEWSSLWLNLFFLFRLTSCGSRSTSTSRQSWATSQPHPNRWVRSWNANSSTWIILCRCRLSNFMTMTCVARCFHTISSLRGKPRFHHCVNILLFCLLRSGCGFFSQQLLLITLAPKKLINLFGFPAPATGKCLTLFAMLRRFVHISRIRHKITFFVIISSKCIYRDFFPVQLSLHNMLSFFARRRSEFRVNLWALRVSMDEISDGKTICGWFMGNYCTFLPLSNDINRKRFVWFAISESNLYRIMLTGTKCGRDMRPR